MTKEEAIKMIENDIRIHHDYLSGKYRQALTMAVVALKERPRGKWIDEGDPLTIRCSKCDYRAARYNNTNYCPNCGADMKGEKDD